MIGIAIRLFGPMQAWGGPVVGDDRPTNLFPTRSGVLGLVSACMGISRWDMRGLLTMANARVHIRVDSPGIMFIDDQIIQGHPMASTIRQTIQSKRGYLADASFVAVVVPNSVEVGTIAAIKEALQYPVFTPCLGRAACPPSEPLLIGEVEADDPLDLFANIPRGPDALMARLEKSGPLAPYDFYLDVERHPQGMRRMRLRNALCGPLPRQFREYTVVEVRGDLATADDEPEADESEPDTTDGWLTDELC